MRVLLVGARVVKSRLPQLLRQRGYEPVSAPSLPEAAAALAEAPFAFTVVDLNFNGDSETQSLKSLRAQGGDPGPIIAFIASGDGAKIRSLRVDGTIRESLTGEALDRAISEVSPRPRRPRLRGSDDSPAAVPSSGIRHLPATSAVPPTHPEEPVASGDRVSLKEIARAAARAAEREAIAEVLEYTGWNRLRAARLLQCSYRALLYKIKDGRFDAWRGAHPDGRDRATKPRAPEARRPEGARRPGFTS
jgi:DNA-binding NtrC family response regulator